MPGPRGPIQREPISDASELRMKHMAKVLVGVTIEQFKREYENGVYDGAYIMRGEVPFFIVGLVKEIQRKRALASIPKGRISRI